MYNNPFNKYNEFYYFAKKTHKETVPIISVTSCASCIPVAEICVVVSHMQHRVALPVEFIKKASHLTEKNLKSDSI